jgi:hypothetical protein
MTEDTTELRLHSEAMHKAPIYISEIIHTFSDVIPRDTKNLASQIHIIARDNMPIQLDEVSKILSRGLDDLWTNEEFDATDLERSLVESGITLRVRFIDFILTRSTKMDKEGQLLVKKHSGLLSLITKEVAPITEAQSLIQSDRDFILGRVDRSARDQYGKIYDLLQETLDKSIKMVCYFHYLQELMRHGIEKGCLTQSHVDLAHKLVRSYFFDRRFLSAAGHNLLERGVRVTESMLKEWEIKAALR